VLIISLLTCFGRLDKVHVIAFMSDSLHSRAATRLLFCFRATFPDYLIQLIKIDVDAAAQTDKKLLVLSGVNPLVKRARSQRKIRPVIDSGNSQKISHTASFHTLNLETQFKSA
jgi:hypothetical protein